MVAYCDDVFIHPFHMKRNLELHNTSKLHLPLTSMHEDNLAKGRE